MPLVCLCALCCPTMAMSVVRCFLRVARVPFVVCISRRGQLRNNAKRNRAKPKPRPKVGSAGVNHASQNHQASGWFCPVIPDLRLGLVSPLIPVSLWYSPHGSGWGCIGTQPELTLLFLSTIRRVSSLLHHACRERGLRKKKNRCLLENSGATLGRQRNADYTSVESTHRCT